MVEKEILLPETYKYISAFLTMKCNLKCSYCLNEIPDKFTRKDFKEIGGSEWVDALNKITSRKNVPITLCGGEPSLHKDFIYIINNLKPKLKIDILTNLSSERIVEKMIKEVNPNRIKRDAPYASIRVSYHPEQMGNGEKLVENVKKLQEKGFSIGIWAVQYPHPKNLESITQMQFRCRDEGIDFRLKDFTGKFEGIGDKGEKFSITYGNYSKYPESTFQENTKNCMCKTSELLIGPNGDAFKCHRDVYSNEFPIENITNEDFILEDKFRQCDKYGQCHPCDVKVKTNYKQELGHTSVEIKNIDKN